MKLGANSIKWAINHIKHKRDTDLFPLLKEYNILFEDEETLEKELCNIDIGSYKWQPYRRFIIPKDEYSYRVAIQLDPIDNILFVAITYQFGDKIEKMRVPIEAKKVFNYRFSPNEKGDLYDKTEGWKDFWSTSKENIEWYTHAVYIDIADFYNRIYHHTLENQLIACGFENQVIKAIKNMLQNTTQTTSQGIPTGPHASHIYAEMCLIPLDEGLILKGYKFCRYADDIIIFTDSEVQAKIIIYEMAKMLDSLKLNMQRNKTRVFSQEEFEAYCDDKLADNPISELEEEMNTELSEYLDDWYGDTGSLDLEDINKEFFSEETLQKILLEYLNSDLDYQRIRWFYRRLSKVGVDTALGVTVKEFDRLVPAINDIALYFASIADSSWTGLKEIGEQIFGLLNNEIIKSNDFFQITILNLFSYTNEFNHISNLIKLYGSSNDYVKREIILAAYTSGATAWIREIKQEYLNLGVWTQRALLIASSLLSVDERKYFIQNVTLNQQENLTTKLLSKIILKK